MLIDIEGIRKSLDWHSSPVDWCEPNYAFYPWVVEFYNTFSCIIFLIIPPILIYLYRGYARRVNVGVQIVWILYIIVGVTSMYFHGTLSLMGQLMDELSILWIFALISSLFIPRYYMPSFAPNRIAFSSVMLIVTVLVSVLSVWRPYINAFAQMFLVGIPAVFLFSIELKRVKNHDKKVYDLGVRSMVIGLAAIFIWFNDRILCDFYRSMGITYLHAIWHIMSFVASYSLAVIASYLYLKIERKEIPCELVYWPCKSMTTMGIPYVKIIEKDQKFKTK